MGRKPLDIAWGEFDKLCEIQCTIQELAAYFRCSEDALLKAVKRVKGVPFGVYFEQMKGSGRVSLRRKMFQTALKGDRQLMVWLSKQHLKMAEKSEVKMSGGIKSENPRTIEEIQAELAEIREKQRAIEGSPDPAAAGTGEGTPPGSGQN